MAQGEADKLYALLEALIDSLQEEDPEKRREKLAELKGRVQSERRSGRISVLNIS
jgi:hypothetical protein